MTVTTTIEFYNAAWAKQRQYVKLNAAYHAPTLQPDTELGQSVLICGSNHKPTPKPKRSPTIRKRSQGWNAKWARA